MPSLAAPPPQAVLGQCLLWRDASLLGLGIGRAAQPILDGLAFLISSAVFFNASAPRAVSVT